MKVSLVKESLKGEKRALFIPEQVKSLAPICDFQVEQSTGIGMNISDSDYRRAGAKIVDRETAWTTADFILKLKRPSIDELALLNPNKAIVAFFHAEIVPKIVDMLLKKKITAYSFEYFQNNDGSFPLMKATGELAGQQAITFAAYHLQSHLSGSGWQLPSSTFVNGAKVAILGYGNVGKAATKMAVHLGANVVVFRWDSDDRSVKIGSKTVENYPWDKRIAHRIIPSCDVVIGAIRISTFDTPCFLGKDLVKKMKRGSLIIDVTAGYGSGYIETSSAVTTLDDPYRVVSGVKHIKIRELPLGIHQTAVRQISRLYFPYIFRMINCIQKGRRDPISSRGIITKDGIICNPQIKRHYKRRYTD